MESKGGVSQKSSNKLVECNLGEKEEEGKVSGSILVILDFTQNVSDLIAKFLDDVLGVKIEKEELKVLEKAKIRYKNSEKRYFDLLKAEEGVDLAELLEAFKKVKLPPELSKNTKSKLKLLLDTCYNKRRAKDLDKVVEILGSTLWGTGDKHSNTAKCRGAAALLAYYAAILKSEREHDGECGTPEVWLAFGDLFRAYVLLRDGKEKERYRRSSIIRLCPWEGDLVALLYATLLYCSSCQKVEVRLELPGEHGRLASVSVDCDTSSGGGSGSQ